jgi:hypothetical protein
MDREEIRAAMCVVRGEGAGNREVAKAILREAGFNVEAIQSRRHVEAVAEMKAIARSHGAVDAGKGARPHWHDGTQCTEATCREAGAGSGKCYPQLTKVEARRLAEERGIIPATRAESVEAFRRLGGS